MKTILASGCGSKDSFNRRTQSDATESAEKVFNTKDTTVAVRTRRKP
jgi:hypothetical protein